MAAISSQLAISLFSSLIIPNGDPNLVCSPLSISSALALVAAGSKGKTLQEIVKTFGWKQDAEGLAKALLTEAEKVASCDGSSCPVKSANNVWIENDFSVLKSYSDFLKSFKIEIGKADFKKHSSEATSQINKWVADHTNQKIPELFSAGVITQDTCAVLVNALYFKGQWAMPFDKSLTRDSQFHVSSNKQVSVKMMFHSGDFKYLDDQKSKCGVIELPYSSKSFSMIIVLPHEIEGLNNLQSSLSLSLISDWIKNVQSATPDTVDVFLPRFKVSQKTNLEDKLKSLGMNTMFSENADLSGISGAPNLYVSSAVHQAVIEVNEEGTEAAAATGIGMNFMSLPMQFNVDRPFMFMIISNVDKSILFIGRVSDPSV